MQESSLKRPLVDKLAAQDLESLPHHLAVVAERRRILRECQLVLTGRQAMLLMLRYEQEFTYAEIAQGFGVSEITVFKMHSRILRVLLAELKRRKITSFDQL